MFITGGNRIKKAGAKSEKETWPNCIIQPYANDFRDAVCNLQQNFESFLFSVKYLWSPDKFSPVFCAFDSQQIKIIRRSLATNSQILPADTRTANFTYNKY